MEFFVNQSIKKIFNAFLKKSKKNEYSLIDRSSNFYTDCLIPTIITKN